MSEAWDTSQYSDTAVALGGPAMPTPLGNVPRPRPAQNPNATGIGSAVPKNSENNLTMARRLREQGENPSGDPAAQNPYSSAGGKNQIIDGTWIDLLNKHKPELVQGKSKEELLALKINGPLNDEMASAYDQDNARMLASNGIAPTPNFIAAMYRAGPQDGMKLIQAARADPNALVRDVAPALASAGNNGAGNLTVGQFLVNPYAKGPGGDPGSSPQQLYTIARGNQILEQQMKDFTEGRDKVAKIDKNYKPIEFAPMPKPPEHDPLQTFSSLAGVFATLAAGFSRTPAIAAMNGLAGAMDAAKKSKWDEYTAHYDQFKTGSELMLKAHEQHSHDIRDALEMMTKNMAAGTAMLSATIALSDDEEMRKLHETQRYVEMGNLADKRDKIARDIKEGMPVTLATADLTARLENLKAAEKGGDPEEIAKAKELVTQAETRLGDVQRAKMGGFKGANPSAANIATQRYIQEHPEATAEDIQRFAVGFKEDAPGVGARKDRELTRKEKLDQMNSDHKDRMAEIASDRNISMVERDRRLAEERERHDKATEVLGEHKAFTADRAQDERERHNARVEEITQDKNLSQNDRAVAALDERTRHDRAMEGKDHTTAHEREMKLFEDDIRADKRFTGASDGEVRAEANRRVAASKRPEEQHLNPAALDMEATQLLLTGQMPSLGMGGTRERVQVINRAAEMAAEQGHTVEDYIAGRATWKADVSSLSQITKISDAVQGFENTALENMKVAESLMNKGAGTRAGPVINRWFQAGKSATGDPDVAAFNTAMGTVAGEYGKIISGGSASIAATPEGARKEAADWLDKIQSPEAIRAQFSVARRDMENRKNSLFRQRGFIQQRIKDPTAPVQVPPSTAGSSAADTARPGEVVHVDAKGNRAVQRDGKWVEVR